MGNDSIDLKVLLTEAVTALPAGSLLMAPRSPMESASQNLSQLQGPLNGGFIEAYTGLVGLELFAGLMGFIVFFFFFFFFFLRVP